MPQKNRPLAEGTLKVLKSGEVLRISEQRRVYKNVLCKHFLETHKPKCEIYWNRRFEMLQRRWLVDKFVKALCI